jgi:MGT family glycosyltransferase
MKIGFISMPLTGHLNPMTALARKVQARGHEVLFLGVPDAEPIVRAAHLQFVPFGAKEFPAGSTVKGYAPLAKLRGDDVLQYSITKMHPRRCQAALEYLPQKLAETGVEALVIDTVHFFVELVAMHLGLPYVHVWNILPIDRSGASPPCSVSWPYENSPEARARNKQAVEKMGNSFGDLLTVAKAYADKNGLQIDWAAPGSTISKLAVIAQIPRELDFPDLPWPGQFHYTGPFHDDAGRQPIPFPWEKLTAEPLIYASMGTLVNGLEQVFRSILAAVGAIPGTQLVLSIGNNISIDDLGPIPSNAIVVSKAPQLELLKRAALCITHAGMNTALEALTQGVPMVALPIGFDQPGVAARIAYHGAGEFIEENNLTAEGLSKLVQTVLNDSSYRDRARYFQKVIANTHGLDVATDVIERAFRT